MSVWDTPPTSEELQRATTQKSVWDTPPTQAELSAAAIPSLPPDPGDAPIMSQGDAAAIGATKLGGLADEFLGALNFLYPANPAGPTAPKRPAAENYTTMRDANIELQETAHEQHPWTTGLADAAVTGAALAGAGVPVPTSWLGAAKQGAVIGGGMGAAESKGNLTSLEKAKELVVDTGVGTGVGAGAGVLGQALMKGVGAGIRGTDTLIRQARGLPTRGQTKGINPAEFKANIKLSEETGVPLNSAQAAGTPTLLAEQEAFRATETGAQALKAQQTTQSNAIYGRIKEIIRSPMGRRETVEKVAKLYAGAEKASARARASQAQADFEAVDALAGNQKVMPLDETLNTIRELKRDFQSAVPNASDVAARKQLGILEKRILERPQGKPVTLLDSRGRPIMQEAVEEGVNPRTTARRFQKALASWGAAARRPEEVFKNVTPSTQSRMAKAIFGALQRDLDNATNEAGKLGEVGQALLNARNNYRAASEAHQAMKDSILDAAVKALGKNHPETMPAKLLAGGASVSDEMVARTIGTIHAVDKEAARGLRSAAMDTLLKRVAPRASSGQEGPLSAQALVDLEGKMSGRLQALFTGDPAGYAAFQKVVEVAKRTYMKGTPDPVNTFFAAILRKPWFRATSGAIASGGPIVALATGNVTAAAGIAGTEVLMAGLVKLGRAMSTRNLSKLLTNPDSSRQLLQLMRPNEGMTIAQANRLVTLLLNDLNQDEK